MAFRRAVKNAVRNLEPKDRSFGLIQTELIISYPQIAVNKAGRIRIRYDEQQLYDELVRLEDSEGVRLETERLNGHVPTAGLGIRQREALGDACSQLPYLDKRMKDDDFDCVNLFGGAERGYIFLLSKFVKLKYGNARAPQCVVKPYQSKTEAAIAKLASEKRIGPKVYDLGKNWFVEEYLSGPPLTSFFSVPFISYNLGALFGRMHAAGIECNHWRFPEESRWDPPARRLRMLDYGASKLGTDFSEDYKNIGNFLRKYKMNNVARENFFDEYERYSGMDARGKVEI